MSSGKFIHNQMNTSINNYVEMHIYPCEYQENESKPHYVVFT